MDRSETKIADRADFWQTVTGLKVIRQDIEFGRGRTRVFATNSNPVSSGQRQEERITVEFIYENVIEYHNE